MKIGDKVWWISQSSGVAREKLGAIIEIVPPGTRPTSRGAMPQPGQSRNHESYIVRATALGRKGKRVYWPRVSDLTLMEKAQ